MTNSTFNTQDAVSANFAECFVTLDGTRYSMVMAKEFEGKASINTKEVYRLGNPVVGHKAQTVALAFSMTIYKCTEIFDRVVEQTTLSRRSVIIHSAENPAGSQYITRYRLTAGTMPQRSAIWRPSPTPLMPSGEQKLTLRYGSVASI